MNFLRSQEIQNGIKNRFFTQKNSPIINKISDTNYESKKEPPKPIWNFGNLSATEN